MASRRLPIISVHDAYKISVDKSAKCTRTYSFYNNGKTPLDIVTRIYEDKFDIRTESHKIEDAPEGERELDCKVNGYNKICYWKPSTIEIPPSGSHEVKISWLWPNFLVTADEKSSLTISYFLQKQLTYSLKIIPHKKDFFNNINHDENPIIQFSQIKDGSLCYGPVKLEEINYRFNLSLTVNPPFDPNRRLPLLKLFGSNAPKNLLKNYIVLMVQHLLGDFIPFVNTLSDCGMDFNSCYVIGIPYSTKKYVADTIKKKIKSQNIVTPEVYPFLGEIEQFLRKAIDRCKKENKKLIIIEDGGYVIPLLHSPQFEDGLKYCIGGVEQTSNGIWEDRKLAETQMLKIPVMDVADSELKKRTESRLIGNAIVGNIERLLNKEYKEGVFRRNCLVIGLGAVGQNIVRRLITDGAFVSGYDRKKETMDIVSSNIEGLKVVKNVAKNISEQSIVIGGTGETHLGFQEFVNAQNNTVFVNATSKKKEIDHKQLESMMDGKDIIEGIGTIYRLNIGKSILLLADGYPINFYDSESVPDMEIQFVPTLLFEATRLLIERRYIKPRIIQIPQRVQIAIRKSFNIIRKAPINI